MSPKEPVGTYDSRNYWNGVPQSVPAMSFLEFLKYVDLYSLNCIYVHVITSFSPSCLLITSGPPANMTTNIM